MLVTMAKGKKKSNKTVQPGGTSKQTSLFDFPTVSRPPLNPRCPPKTNRLTLKTPLWREHLLKAKGSNVYRPPNHPLPRLEWRSPRKRRAPQLPLKKKLLHQDHLLKKSKRNPTLPQPLLHQMTRLHQPSKEFYIQTILTIWHPQQCLCPQVEMTWRYLKDWLLT